MPDLLVVSFMRRSLLQLKNRFRTSIFQKFNASQKIFHKNVTSMKKFSIFPAYQWFSIDLLVWSIQNFLKYSLKTLHQLIFLGFSLFVFKIQGKYFWRIPVSCQRFRLYYGTWYGNHQFWLRLIANTVKQHFADFHQFNNGILNKRIKSWEKNIHLLSVPLFF